MSDTSISVPAFFSGMSPEHLRVLRDASVYSEFGSGDVIFREGSPANCFYLIHEGRVALEADMNGEGLLQIGVINDGEPLGWSWLFPPHIWRFHARALMRTTVTRFDAEVLRQLSERDHDLGYELMKRMSQVMLGRLQAVRDELVKLSEAEPSMQQPEKNDPHQRRRQCPE